MEHIVTVTGSVTVSVSKGSFYSAAATWTSTLNQKCTSFFFFCIYEIYSSSKVKQSFSFITVHRSSIVQTSVNYFHKIYIGLELWKAYWISYSLAYLHSACTLSQIHCICLCGRVSLCLFAKSSFSTGTALFFILHKSTVSHFCGWDGWNRCIASLQLLNKSVND